MGDEIATVCDSMSDPMALITQPRRWKPSAVTPMKTTDRKRSTHYWEYSEARSWAESLNICHVLLKMDRHLSTQLSIAAISAEPRLFTLCLQALLSFYKVINNSQRPAAIHHSITYCVLMGSFAQKTVSIMWL